MTSKEALDIMLNCFAGADGGVEFIAFRLFLEIMEKDAPNGNLLAQKAIDATVQVAKMIKAAPLILKKT